MFEVSGHMKAQGLFVPGLTEVPEMFTGVYSGRLMPLNGDLKPGGISKIQLCLNLL